MLLEALSTPAGQGCVSPRGDSNCASETDRQRQDDIPTNDTAVWHAHARETEAQFNPTMKIEFRWHFSPTSSMARIETLEHSRCTVPEGEQIRVAEVSVVVEIQLAISAHD